jgi:nucleoside-diphosphate-sugar epimerase
MVRIHCTEHTFSARRFGTPSTDINLPPGWTAFINGFFETVIPRMVQWDLDQGIIRVVGKGTTAYPFVFRHDIGRAIAQTLKAPAATYKDTWVLLASGWVSGNEIAEWVQEAAARKKLVVEHVEPNAQSTPIVALLENSGRNVFDRKLTTELGVQWGDLKAYVTGLVR